MNAKGFRHICMWLPPELKEPVEKCATDCGLPISTTIERILTCYFWRKNIAEAMEELGAIKNEKNIQ